MKKFFIHCLITLCCCSNLYSMASRRNRSLPTLQPVLFHTAHHANKFIARFNAYTTFAHNLACEIAASEKNAEEEKALSHEQQAHNYTLLRLKKLEKYVESIKNEQLLKFFNPSHKPSPALIGSLFQNFLTQQENKGGLSSLPATLNLVDNTTLKELERIKISILTDALTLEYKEVIKQQLQQLFSAHTPLDTAQVNECNATLSKSVDSLSSL